MIDNIKNLTMIICFLSVFIAILEISSPNKKLKNIFTMFLNMFILLIIVSSVLNFFNMDYSKIQYNNEDYNKSLINEEEDILSIMDKQIESSLKQNIHSILLSNNINAKDIEIKLIRDKDKNIDIEYINIYLNNQGNGKSAEIIKQYINTNINIFYK